MPVENQTIKWNRKHLANNIYDFNYLVNFWSKKKTFVHCYHDYDSNDMMITTSNYLLIECTVKFKTCYKLDNVKLLILLSAIKSLWITSYVKFTKYYNPIRVYRVIAPRVVWSRLSVCKKYVWLINSLLSYYSFLLLRCIR